MDDGRAGEALRGSPGADVGKDEEMMADAVKALAGLGWKAAIARAAVAAAARSLAADAPRMAAGAHGLAAGAHGLAAGAHGLAAGAHGLAAGAPRLAAGAHGLAASESVTIERLVFEALRRCPRPGA